MYKVYLPHLQRCLVCLLGLRVAGGHPKYSLAIDMMLWPLRAGPRFLSFFEIAKTARNTAIMLPTLKFSGKK
jgi:hypothetical protein